MKALATPRVIVSFVFGVGMIVFLLGYADVGRVLSVASTFQPIYLLLILALAVMYEAARALQWIVMLRALDRREPWRAAVMSFMGGEMAKILPGGQYFQTYLLRQAQGMPIARSAAATTVILWLEVVVCLLIVGLLDIAAWPWVRPAAALLLCGIALIVLALKRRAFSATAPAALAGRPRLQWAWAWYTRFAASATDLLRPRVLGPAGLLAVAYIGCAALSLWAIAAALGIDSIGPDRAVLVYTFALGMGLIIPIPLDLGLTEVSGLAVLVALGVARADALTVMLMQRILSSVLTSGIALVTLAALRRQLMTTLDGATPRATAPVAPGTPEPEDG